MKIYNAPEEIEVPQWDHKVGRTANLKKEQDYYKALREWCIKRLKPETADENIGKIVRFHYADGYALYMVANLKPLELIHIATGDAWEYPYISRLTKKDILKSIKRYEKLEEVFSKVIL